VVERDSTPALLSRVPNDFVGVERTGTAPLLKVVAEAEGRARGSFGVYSEDNELGPVGTGAWRGDRGLSLSFSRSFSLSRLLSLSLSPGLSWPPELYVR
jgi:hypothetical protein